MSRAPVNIIDPSAGAAANIGTASQNLQAQADREMQALALKQQSEQLLLNQKLQEQAIKSREDIASEEIQARSQGFERQREFQAKENALQRQQIEKESGRTRTHEENLIKMKEGMATKRQERATQASMAFLADDQEMSAKKFEEIEVIEDAEAMLDEAISASMFVQDVMGDRPTNVKGLMEALQTTVAGDLEVRKNRLKRVGTALDASLSSAEGETTEQRTQSTVSGLVDRLDLNDITISNNKTAEAKELLASYLNSMVRYDLALKKNKPDEVGIGSADFELTAAGHNLESLSLIMSQGDIAAYIQATESSANALEGAKEKDADKEILQSIGRVRKWTSQVQGFPGSLAFKSASLKFRGPTDASALRGAVATAVTSMIDGLSDEELEKRMGNIPRDLMNTILDYRDEYSANIEQRLTAIEERIDPEFRSRLSQPLTIGTLKETMEELQTLRRGQEVAKRGVTSELAGERAKRIRQFSKDLTPDQVTNLLRQ